MLNNIINDVLEDINKYFIDLRKLDSDTFWMTMIILASIGIFAVFAIGVMQE